MFEVYVLESWKGKVRLCHSTNYGKTRDFRRWTSWSIPDARMYSDYAKYSGNWETSSFDMQWNSVEKSLAAPYWFLALATGIFAYVAKPRPKLQFTLLDTLSLSVFFAIVVSGFSLWARSLT